MDTMTEIRDYLVSELPPERASFASDENLLAKGALDSMGLLKLVMFLEQRFDFHARDEDMIPDNFVTLEKIRDFVERKQRG